MVSKAEIVAQNEAMQKDLKECWATIQRLETEISQLKGTIKTYRGMLGMPEEAE